jgi:predicted TIM-barrel fold metal-dependent hydrolase
MRLQGLDYGVIDLHTHMGNIYCMHYSASSADDMSDYMDKAGIELSLSAPNEDLFTMPQTYAMIEDAMARYPGKILGYYSVNPLSGVEGKDVASAFARAPYAGLKFLPDYHETPLDDSVFAPALEYANEHHMLVLSHTWGTGRCNTAAQIVNVLDRYPNLRLLMGHCIQGQVDEAIALSAAYPNAYLDLCDTGRLSGVIEKMAAKVGPEKIVYGTDWPWLSPEYLIGAVFYARIDADAKRMILRDNALRILKETGSARVIEILGRRSIKLPVTV